MSMPDDLAALLYKYGGVTGRGAPEDTPIIDLRLFDDVVPILGFHDQVRPYIFDARLRERGLGASQVIWNGVPLATEAIPVAQAWADAIDRNYRPDLDRGTVVEQSAPHGAIDTCVVPTSVTDILGIRLPNVPTIDIPLCSDLFRLTAGSTTRREAGGPETDDNIKCQLKPLRRSDYPAAMTDAEFARLQALFTTGVCDWSKPGVGWVDHAVTWASVGDDQLQPPHQVVNEVARSAGPAAAAVSPSGAPTATVEAAAAVDAAVTGETSLPTTGGSERTAVVAAALLMIVALTLRPGRRT
jgi:hypothetical protein